MDAGRGFGREGRVVVGSLQAQFRFQDLSLLQGAGAGVTGSQVILHSLAARR